MITTLKSALLRKHRGILENWFFDSENDDLIPWFWTIPNIDSLSEDAIEDYVISLCDAVVLAHARGYVVDDSNACVNKYYTDYFPSWSLRAFGRVVKYPPVFGVKP